MTNEKAHHISDEALFRYQLVAEIRAYLVARRPLAEAITIVLRLTHRDLLGRDRRLSARTLYRWLRAFERGGLEALEPELRPHVADSTILAPALLDFLRLEKKADEEASVPELLRRARKLGILAPDQAIDRISVWRAMCRMGLPMTRVRRLADTDMRRFEYPNRMLMVLADGKRFRAGIERLKRVAIVFLDDATRFALGVLVGTSESTQLFLAALYGAIRHHGLMAALFLDNGSGFISRDTRTVVAHLRLSLIHGTAGYPEGHGKIERFNRTFKAQVLRSLDGNPEVDPEPSALTLRIQHWLENTYNHTPHEGIGGQTPDQKWREDPRPLTFPEDVEWLNSRFRVSFQRTVSKDNVISFEGQDYEIPRGHAGRRISVTRLVLREPGVLCVSHDGHLVQIYPVDLVANAYSRRAGSTPAAAASNQPITPSSPTAAQLDFDEHFDTLLDTEGGFPEGDDNE